MVPDFARGRLAALVLLLLAIAAGGFALACSDGGEPKLDIEEMRGARVSPAYEKPSATLTSTEGKPFDLQAETKDRVTLFYIGYTHCPDVCPTHMHDIAKAMEALPEKDREQLRVVFVTADPERDTPQVLGDWLHFFDPSFIGLTGTMDEITALLDQLNMEPGDHHDLGDGNYSVDHAAYVIAFERDGTGRLVYPLGFTIEDWEHDLALLAKRG